MDRAADADVSSVLVVSREAQAIAEQLQAACPGLTVTWRAPEAVRPGDGAGVQALVSFRVPDALRDGLQALRWIQSTGAGVDGILRSPALPPGVRITRLVGVFGVMMAEYVFARLLALCQGMHRQIDDQRARRWRGQPPRSLCGMHVVVLGIGDIGSIVARRLVQWGARVTGVSRSGRPVPGLPEVLPVAQLERAITGAGALVLLAPRTAATERLIGAREIGLLADGALLVNAARGALVDELAVVDALRSRKLAGAALDVFEVEPLPEHSPLWNVDNLLISPHVAAITAPSMVARVFAANRTRLREGRALLGEVDRQRGY